MKKLLFLVFASAVALNAVAQIKKGDKLIGVGIGSISYTNSDEKQSQTNSPSVLNTDGSSFNITVNPSVAWFVQDNLAIGGGVNLSFSSQKDKESFSGSSQTSVFKSSRPSFYIGPMARYYFGSSPKGSPFAQLDFGIGFDLGKSTYTYSNGIGNDEVKAKPKGDWNVGATFGYEHFLTSCCPCLGLFGSIGFNYGQSKTTYEVRPIGGGGAGYDNTTDYSRFYIPVNVGLQVHLFGKNKKK